MAMDLLQVWYLGLKIYKIKQFTVEDGHVDISYQQPASHNVGNVFPSRAKANDVLILKMEICENICGDMNARLGLHRP